MFFLYPATLSGQDYVNNHRCSYHETATASSAYSSGRKTSYHDPKPGSQGIWGMVARSYMVGSQGFSGRVVEGLRYGHGGRKRAEVESQGV